MALPVSAVSLAVALLMLLLVAVRSIRPSARPAMGREEHLRRWSALHSGIDPRRNRVVLMWLHGMYVVGRPLARLGVHPDVITVSGLWWAFAAWALTAPGDRWPLLATGALIAGSLADALDGTVAVLTERTTAWGAVLDGAVDRLADLVYLTALWTLGGDGAVVVTAAAALFLLEYVRARAGQEGARMQRVTIGERPTRLIVAGLSMWCAGLFPAHAGGIGTTGAWSVAGVSMVGLVQLIPAVRRALR